MLRQVQSIVMWWWPKSSCLHFALLLLLPAWLVSLDLPTHRKQWENADQQPTHKKVAHREMSELPEVNIKSVALGTVMRNLQATRSPLDVVRMFTDTDLDDRHLSDWLVRQVQHTSDAHQSFIQGRQGRSSQHLGQGQKSGLGEGQSADIGQGVVVGGEGELESEDGEMKGFSPLLDNFTLDSVGGEEKSFTSMDYPADQAEPFDIMEIFEAALYHREEAEVNPQLQCRKPRPYVHFMRDPVQPLIFIPQCVVVHRCAAWTGCCPQINMECAPKTTSYFYRAFFVFSPLNSTEVILDPEFVRYVRVENHTECACKVKPRTLPVCTKDCPRLFNKVRVERGCTCDCTRVMAADDEGCDRVKHGLKSLTDDDLVCIKSGKCYQPGCHRGQFNVYTGYCPISEKYIPVGMFDSYKQAISYGQYLRKSRRQEDDKRMSTTPGYTRSEGSSRNRTTTTSFEHGLSKTLPGEYNSAKNENAQKSDNVWSTPIPLEQISDQMRTTGYPTSDSTDVTSSQTLRHHTGGSNPYFNGDSSGSVLDKTNSSKNKTDTRGGRNQKPEHARKERTFSPTVKPTTKSSLPTKKKKTFSKQNKNVDKHISNGFFAEKYQKQGTSRAYHENFNKFRYKNFLEKKRTSTPLVKSTRTFAKTTRPSQSPSTTPPVAHQKHIVEQAAASSTKMTSHSSTQQPMTSDLTSQRSSKRVSAETNDHSFNRTSEGNEYPSKRVSETNAQTTPKPETPSTGPSRLPPKTTLAKPSPQEWEEAKEKEKAEREIQEGNEAVGGDRQDTTTFRPVKTSSLLLSKIVPSAAPTQRTELHSTDVKTRAIKAVTSLPQKSDLVVSRSKKLASTSTESYPNQKTVAPSSKKTTQKPTTSLGEAKGAVDASQRHRTAALTPEAPQSTTTNPFTDEEDFPESDSEGVDTLGGMYGYDYSVEGSGD